MLVIEEIAVKLERLYNRGKAELKNYSIVAELTEKKKAHEVLSDWHAKYLDGESFIS